VATNKDLYYDGRELSTDLITLYFSRLGEIDDLLDIACGTGEILRYAQNEGINPIGIDIDVGALNRANERSNVALVDLETGVLPFADDSFDGIIAKDILEHLDSPSEIVREISRVLRPDGRLLISVPMAKPRVVWNDYTHVRGFTRRAIRLMLEDNGFEVEQITPMGGVPGADRFKVVCYLPSILRFPFLRRFAVSHEVVAKPR